MSLFYNFLINVCLRKIKDNHIFSFSIMYDGQEYLIIFHSKKYIIDNSISGRDISNNHLRKIFVNLYALIQLKIDNMYPYYYKQLNIDYIN